MNYNKHLEELNKFRESIRDIQQTVEGLGIELGNYIDEFEQIRDDAEKRKIDPDFFDRDYPNTKKRSDDDKVEEAITKRMKKIAGIL
tara:strand:+ start:833 stop:1093 length:261 start_codon:yes stop_codon:yes gene_type:complete